MRYRGESLLKICGVANIEDGVFAHDCGADIIGVILDKRVPRHGDQSLISSLTSMRIRTAAVYTSLESAVSRYGDEDLIQLHFPHDPEKIGFVKEKTGKGVISVIQFDRTENLEEDVKRRYEAGAEIVLLENKSGIVKFISEIEKIQLSIKTGLAGKISPQNVGDIAAVNPLMIDVSSSIESYPGKKDHGLIRQLFRSLEAA